MHPFELLDKKLQKILRVFVENKGTLYHLQEISRVSGVPAATTFRLVKRLVDKRLLEVVRVGKLKIYRLDDEPDTTVLVDSKLKKILDCVGGGKFYHLHEISSLSGVAVATTFRLVKRLVALGYLEVVLVGKLKIYQASRRVRP